MTTRRGCRMRPVFVVDPIDGTRALLRGLELSGVSASQSVTDGRPVAGVLYAPALGRTVRMRRRRPRR